jgi:hypothetical protein
MTRNVPDRGVQIHLDRAGFETASRHRVRCRMEALVCAWLQERGIAHRHASEVFTVSPGPDKAPALYLPDIVLHDRMPGGKKVIIELFQMHVPKPGGTRMLAAFRSGMKKHCRLILVARAGDFGHIARDAYDVLIDIDHLDTLARRIPRPPAP